MYKNKVSVSSNGSCAWYKPVRLKTICALDVSYFPFDDQECHFKFGSWTLDASKIDMIAVNVSEMNTFYIPNGEWELMNRKAIRNEHYYQCCPVPFVDVTVFIFLRRHALNYTFN